MKQNEIFKWEEKTATQIMPACIPAYLKKAHSSWYKRGADGRFAAMVYDIRRLNKLVMATGYEDEGRG